VSACVLAKYFTIEVILTDSPLPPGTIAPAGRPGEAPNTEGVPMTPHRSAPLLQVRQAGHLTLAVVLTDDLSEANAEALGEELSRLLEGAARPRLRLDLARVRFLTSTVLGKLVGLHRRVRAAGGELTLLNVTGVVYEVFEATRLHQLLDVRRSWPEDSPPLPVAS
jgi:anti-anti-sigma factor